jgi:cysteinyl-tRNA synthetase
VAELKAEAGELPGVDHSLSENGEAYLAEFNKKMASDLNTPQAIASVRAMLNDTDLSARDRLHLMLDFDEVLGLGVESWLTISLEVPQQVVELADRRDAARASKSWDEADKLREEIAALGFVVEDSPEGRKILKK